MKIDASKLATAICIFPFMSGGQPAGNCPRCGSLAPVYGFPTGSRFKACSRCGYDRQKQILFSAIRGDVQKGAAVAADDAAFAVDYFNQVFASTPSGSRLGKAA